MAEILEQARAIVAAADPLSEVARQDTVVAQAVSPTGTIVDISYWNPATGTYQATPPTLQIDQEGGAAIYGRNDTDINQDMRVDCVVMAPDGTTGTLTGPTWTVLPRLTYVWEMRVPGRQAGEYTGTFILYAFGYEVDRRENVAFATVEAPPPPPAPEPRGMIHLVQFWNPATGSWQDTAPTVLVGETIGVRVAAMNTTDYRQNMRLDAAWKRDGVSFLEGTGEVQLVLPRMAASWESAIVADTPGTYSVTLILLAEVVT